MPDVLMITAIAGAENCAAALSKQFQVGVETVSSRKDALAALRRREYLLVVIDESMIEPGEDGSDALFRQAGLAIPLEINFAISGCGRLVRAVRAALSRGQAEREAATRAALASVQSDLRETVAGLLLHAQLALAAAALSPELEARLRVIRELAGTLRQRLEVPLAQANEAGPPSLARTAAAPLIASGKQPTAATPQPRKPLAAALPAIPHSSRSGTGFMPLDR